ncbi:MAG TPA: hypothetical protein VM056_04690 [Terriglobales bacterium]|nr:hypothetical protein [Terriglobales bacterium]
MRDRHDWRFFFVCLMALVLFIGLPSKATGQGAKGATYFKQAIKVPYALKDGSNKVINPGEYMVKIQDEGGIPTLTISSVSGDQLLKSRGDRELIPEKEQTFQRGGRFRIMPMTDPKGAATRLIVFLYDFVHARGGQYVRYQFKIAEAAAPAN